jgi:hypothetical protein
LKTPYIPKQALVWVYPVAKIETAVEPRLLSVKAAAAYLSTSAWTVRQLGWHKKIPIVRLGRSVAFGIDRNPTLYPTGFFHWCRFCLPNRWVN